MNDFIVWLLFISPQYEILYKAGSALQTGFTEKIFYLDFAKLCSYHILLGVCARADEEDVLAGVIY